MNDPPDDEGLRQTVGRRLDGVVQGQAPLAAVSEQSLEAGRVVRGRVLSITLFEKTPISIAVSDIGSTFDEVDSGNQLRQLQLFDL